MYVCLYFRGFMLCFMLASTVHNHDYYFTSVYSWLCILFLFYIFLWTLLILGFMLIMCVCIWRFLPSVSSVFVLSFFSTYVHYYITSEFATSLVFTELFQSCLITCFLVINALFNCFVLWLPHLLLPQPPSFVFYLFAFSRKHFMLFSPLYVTMIAIVILVFIIVVIG